ncbi:MAG: hypothetical protein HC844_13040 [Tabrizicola sp.]|nr:hypothetical protein [Tabrizicola sp.]
MRDLCRVAVLSLGLPFAAAPILAEEIAGSRFTAGAFWQGSAETGDDGQFLYCSVSIIHGEGQQLWFLLRRDDRFLILLTTSAHSFTPGTAFESGLGINGGPVSAFRADALDANTMAMSFPDIAHAIRTMRQSDTLTIMVSPTFALTVGTPEIAAALDAAKACLDANVAPGTGPGATSP